MMSLVWKSYQHSEFLVWEELKLLGIENCLTSKTDDYTHKPNNYANLTFLYQKVRACTSLSLHSQKTYFTSQIHSDRMVIVPSNTYAQPYPFAINIPSADGLITEKKGVCLITQYADCLPISLFDTQKKVLATIHSGWRGSKQKILQKALDIFFFFYHCKAKDLHLFFWPSLLQEDFEVEDEVYQLFASSYSNISSYTLQRNNKFYIDTLALNRDLALQRNIPAQNIHISYLSTLQDEHFHSYRREKNKAGRMALFCQMM